MPPNTVVVARGTRWGNLFVIRPDLEPGTKVGLSAAVPTREDAVARYRDYLKASPDLQEEACRELRGRTWLAVCAR